MLRETVLSELELMPLWRLRDKSAESVSEPLAELTLVVLSRVDGASGWLLIAEPLADDAAVLFINILRAMRLQQGASRRITSAQLAAEVAGNEVSWLWLMGAAVAQSVMALPLAAAVRQQWQGLPVLLSEHAQVLSVQPAAKAKLWADWCRWQDGN